ncbi:hypothetical protein [Natrinema halophilum]|uniref:Uncharacterized protein n=1 Tax=Natrinema halophilum TaxID=1699371 RepID=A0A7D5KJH7_9EURY|nr:hypothetical protein [Natrinema halophilum]QLG49459.1 hypothetical protein HYG82_11590 [Natrinema halophilum]
MDESRQRNLPLFAVVAFVAVVGFGVALLDLPRDRITGGAVVLGVALVGLALVLPALILSEWQSADEKE